MLSLARDMFTEKRVYMAHSALIQAAIDLRELIESEADGIEENCTISQPVVDAIEKSGLFRLSTPKEIGGLEADVDTVAAVCEAMSFSDGATGWAFTQNTIVGSYLSYVEPESAKQFAALRAGAGHFAPIGIAHEEEGGYRVSGNWQFASGSGHAEFMGGGAIIMRDGEVAPMGDDGKLPLVGFFVPADKAILKGNWDTMGLRGTGSFDYEIPEVFVEEGVTWNINMGYAPRKSGGAVFSLGPQAYGCIGSCGWALGVASRALYEIAEIAKAGRTRLGSAALRDQEEFQRDLGFHQTAVDGARIQFLTIYNQAVDIIDSGASDEECSEAVRQCKAHANYVVKQAAKSAVIFAWEASGSAGMRNPSRLQRCFRDIYIGTAHQVFDDKGYREVIKPALGIEPVPF
jgi:alkylation response protein AidB-like acyl-CoA dehydrogenase